MTARPVARIDRFMNVSFACSQHPLFWQCAEPGGRAQTAGRADIRADSMPDQRPVRAGPVEKSILLSGNRLYFLLSHQRVPSALLAMRGTVRRGRTWDPSVTFAPMWTVSPSIQHLGGSHSFKCDVRALRAARRSPWRQHCASIGVRAARLKLGRRVRMPSQSGPGKNEREGDRRTMLQSPVMSRSVKH